MQCQCSELGEMTSLRDPHDDNLINFLHQAFTSIKGLHGEMLDS